MCFLGRCRLTWPLGLQISELPLDPRLGAALLAAGRLGCAGDVATVAAMLCVQGIWFTGGGDRRALEAAKAKCAPLVLFQENPLLTWSSSRADRACMLGMSFCVLHGVSRLKCGCMSPSASSKAAPRLQ